MKNGILGGTAASLALTVGLLAGAASAEAGAIRAGFDSNTLAANDDGSTGSVSMGLSANFFGTTYSSLFVNNNGNVTFDSALSAFTPFGLAASGRVIIAPFFADVDTRVGNETKYGTGTVSGRAAFGATWIDVGYFGFHQDKLNSFQVVIIDRSDTGAGNFDFELNIDKVQWETGDFSGGSGGLGGTSAIVGYSNGTVANSFELAGSLVNGAFLDSGPAATSLIQNSLNSGVLGRYTFNVRNGVVSAVPLPSSAAMGLAVLAGVALVSAARRRRRPLTV